MSRAGGRAGAYHRVREQQLSLRTSSSSSYQPHQPSITRPKSSSYSSYPSGPTQPVGPPPYPKSVITFEFYDPPPAMADSTGDPSPHQLVASPQRRPLRVMAPRNNSPKPGSRGVRKLGGGGGGGGGGKVGAQRTNSASPTTLGHYQSNTGYFTITAYLPFDGGKRLKVRRERDR